MSSLTKPIINLNPITIEMQNSDNQILVKGPIDDVKELIDVRQEALSFDTVIEH